MEQQNPNWDAALMAAGMAAVYNADDWHSIVDNAVPANDSLIPYFVIPG